MTVTLSKRERYVAIGVVAALGIFLADQYAVEPFLAAEKQVKEDTDAAVEKQAKAERLFRRESDLRRVWSDMTSGGLTNNEAEATVQAMKAVNDWMQRARVAQMGLKPERTTTENKFIVSSFHLEGGGNMASIAKLINALETADIPVRINEITIRPKTREGTDDLRVDMSVSTLSMLPDADKTTNQPKPAPAAGRSTAAEDRL